MKKLIVLSSFMPLFLGVAAQINYGVHAGGSFAKITDELTDPTSGLTETLKSSSKFGLVFGAVAEFPIAKSISLRPELNFIQKNVNYNIFLFEMGSSSDFDFLLNYLEIPVNVVYNLPVGTGRLFFGGGPSLAFGLSGKAKSGSTHIDILFDGKSNSDMNDPDLHLNRFDVGLGLIAGQTFSNGIYGTIGYNFGLSNMDPDPEYSKMKSQGLVLKVGYMFGSKQVRKK